MTHTLSIVHRTNPIRLYQTTDAECFSQTVRESQAPITIDQISTIQLGQNRAHTLCDKGTDPVGAEKVLNNFFGVETPPTIPRDLHANPSLSVSVLPPANPIPRNTQPSGNPKVQLGNHIQIGPIITNNSKGTISIGVQR